MANMNTMGDINILITIDIKVEAIFEEENMSQVNSVFMWITE